MTVMDKIEFTAHSKTRLLRGFVRNPQLYPGGAESAPPRLDRVKIHQVVAEKNQFLIFEINFN
jgi:hypothetical protein